MKNLKVLLSVQRLPDCLLRRITSNVLLGIIIGLVSIAVSIALKDTRNLVLLLVSLYFFGIGIVTIIQFNRGSILEKPAYCASVTPANMISGSNEVVFHFSDNKSVPATIYIPKKGCAFLAGHSYILYVPQWNPSQILAFQPAN